MYNKTATAIAKSKIRSLTTDGNQCYTQDSLGADARALPFLPSVYFCRHLGWKSQISAFVAPRWWIPLAWREVVVLSAGQTFSTKSSNVWNKKWDLTYVEPWIKVWQLVFKLPEFLEGFVDCLEPKPRSLHTIFKWRQPLQCSEQCECQTKLQHPNSSPQYLRSESSRSMYFLCHVWDRSFQCSSVNRPRRFKAAVKANKISLMRPHMSTPSWARISSGLRALWKTCTTTG